MNDDRYILPGPSNSFYLFSLSAACRNCDGPDGITIEWFDNMRALREWLAGAELPPQLCFADWPDTKGLCIVTGRTKDEFVKALKGNLVGADANSFVDESSGICDEIAAETILEEMYEDTTFQPQVVKPK
jgi:hypothetical protein